MSFRLVPKSVTLNDLERRNGSYFIYFSEFGYLPGVLRKSSRSLFHLLMSSCPFSCWFLNGPYDSAALLRCLWLSVQAFCHDSRRLSFWLTDVRTVCDSVCFRCFRQWTKSCWHHWMNIFHQLFWMAEYCAAVRFTQLRGMTIFEHKHFTKYSVAKRLRCGGTFNDCFARNLV